MVYVSWGQSCKDVREKKLAVRKDRRWGRGFQGIYAKRSSSSKVNESGGPWGISPEGNVPGEVVRQALYSHRTTGGHKSRHFPDTLVRAAGRWVLEVISARGDRCCLLTFSAYVVGGCRSGKLERSKGIRVMVTRCQVYRQ